MTTPATPHPPGATLHLGGNAWAHPVLEPLLVPIDTVTPFPGNPRRGDQDAITASLRDLGLYRAVVMQEATRHVLAGNHTLRGLLALGATQVPVTPLALDDTRAAALVARDNRTSDLSVNDDGSLYALLSALDEQDSLDLAGFSSDDLTDLAALLAPPDLDDLLDDHGPPTDDDHLETIKVRVMPKTARLWRAAREAVGKNDPVATDTALVEAVHAALVKAGRPSS